MSGNNGGTSFEKFMASLPGKDDISKQKLQIVVTDGVVPEATSQARLEEKLSSVLQNVFGDDRESKTLLSGVLLKKLTPAHELSLQVGEFVLQDSINARNAVIEFMGSGKVPLTQNDAEMLSDIVFTAMDDYIQSQNNTNFGSFE